jgi:sigma-B regulation protein RsbU (phosphoserine phosphatase)
MRRELEIGRDIQTGFLPDALPCLPGWEVAVRLRAARQVSGDFYDAFAIGDGLLGLVIADVCDKGVGAALFMAIFRTLIRATAAEHQCGAGDDVAIACLRRTIGATNDYIARTHARANMFATVFFAVVDVHTGVVHYINGGHEPPVIAGGGAIKGRLAPTGPAVGLEADAHFRVSSAQLDPGDILIGFTDGASEARAADGTQFGDDRVTELCAARACSADELLARLEAAVHAHAGEAEQSDDIALIAVRRSGA